MRPGESLYRLIMRGAHAVSPLLLHGESKLARGLRARSGAVDHLEAWAGSQRRPEQPLVWIHAPSVGEGQQALAVMRELKGRMPDLQTAYTWFSPSAERFGLGTEADVAGYLPWDLPGPVSRALDALRPSLLVFTKTEVWPTLTREATARGIPVALVAGTLRPGAGRSSGLGRLLLSSSFSALSRVCAVHESDAHALVGLGVDPATLSVTGDPGVDAALERAAAARTESAHLAPFRALIGMGQGEGRASRPYEHLVLVAGSTWPDDEDWLRRAARGFKASPGRSASAAVRLTVVLAPHEPTPSRVAELKSAWDRPDRPARTLTEVEAAGALEDATTVVVDRLGVLSQLYTVGDLAYVGGGIGRSGLHSVVEPAACSLPILHGPNHRSSLIAGELLEAGGARVVNDAEELKQAIGLWVEDRAARLEAGRMAREALERHRGASDRTAEALVASLD